jgi:di/tripeptidase
MTEILAGKDLNMTEINHLIYSAATALTEEINGTGSYKAETQMPETPPWVRRIQDSINGIRKELSALAEIKTNDRNTNNMRRKRLLRKYKTETKENLDQVTEELKQKVSAKTQ